MTHKIKSWKLSATWSDGKTEGLAVHLPEYLVEELQIYFRELEGCRAECEETEEGYSWFEDREVAV
jgi:hypothetical protein